MFFFVLSNGVFFEFNLSRVSLVFGAWLVFCFACTHRCALYLVLLPA